MTGQAQATDGASLSSPVWPVYTHDPVVAVAAAQWVDDAYAQVRDWFLVPVTIQQTHGVSPGQPPQDPLLACVIDATSYSLRLNRPAIPPACELGAGEGLRLPDIANAPADIVRLWQQLANEAKHPAAVARFHDLLFVRRDGNGRQHATTAADNYIAAAHSCERHDGIDALIRAWDLTRRVGDSAAEERVRSEMYNLAALLMSDGSDAPGWVLPLISALVVSPRAPGKGASTGGTISDSAIDDLLEEAFKLFSPKGFASEVATYLRARTNDPDNIDAINRREVQARLEHARTFTGLARMSWLEDVEAVARRHGLNDIARQIVAEMQAIPVTREFRRVSFSAATSPQLVEGFLSGFTRGQRWSDGLTYFLDTDCPTGTRAGLEKMYRDTANVSVFRRMIPTVITNADGLPVWTTNGQKQEDAYHLASIAKIPGIQQGRLLAEGLRRLAEHYGTPAEHELIGLLSVRGSSDPGLTACLARAFRHFWSNDFEACVHVITPKVETAARTLLRSLDEGIYQTQRANNQGGYPALFDLLRELEKLALDESWAYFLNWLFLGPNGLNIRNDVAHGLVGDVASPYAALVLRAAALLITITPSREQNEDATASDEQINLLDDIEEVDREELLAALRTPVSQAIRLPDQASVVQRVLRLTAAPLRWTAFGLLAGARRLDGRFVTPGYYRNPAERGPASQTSDQHNEH